MKNIRNNQGAIIAMEGCQLGQRAVDVFTAQGAKGANFSETLHQQHLIANISDGTCLRLMYKTFQYKWHLWHPVRVWCRKVPYFIHCLSVRDTTRPFLGECHANSILKDYSLVVVVGEYSTTRADTPKDVEATKPTYTQIQQFNVLNQLLNGTQRTLSPLLSRGFRACSA